MESNLQNRVLKQLARYKRLQSSLENTKVNLAESQKMLDKVQKEQALLERATVAVQQARPLLSASSIKQCEALANSCIQSVFEFPYTVEYDVESCRFKLNKGDYVTDLADAEGGGIVTAISFVFSVYLLVKLGKRMFMAFDEAFTQISDKFFPSFLAFVRQMCHDLNCDICLISHDARISSDDVDHVILIENGKSRRLK